MNDAPPMLTGRQALLLLPAIGAVIACMLATVAVVTTPA